MNSIVKIAKEKGMCPRTIYSRYERGWILEDAINKPIVSPRETIKKVRWNKYGDLVKKYDQSTYRRIVYWTQKGIPLRTAIKVCTTSKYDRVEDYL